MTDKLQWSFIHFYSGASCFIYLSDRGRETKADMHPPEFSSLLSSSFSEGCFQEEHTFLNYLAPKLLDPDCFLIENTSDREVFLPFCSSV